MPSLAESRRATRAIDVIGVEIGMTGHDARTALINAGDGGPEDIIAAVEGLGYSPSTADKFAQAVIDSEVIFDTSIPPVPYVEDQDDIPPADDRAEFDEEDHPRDEDGRFVAAEPDEQSEAEREAEDLFADSSIKG